MWGTLSVLRGVLWIILPVVGRGARGWPSRVSRLEEPVAHAADGFDGVRRELASQVPDVDLDHVRVALEASDHALVLVHGDVVLRGTSDEVANHPDLESAYLGAAVVEPVVRPR